MRRTVTIPKPLSKCGFRARKRYRTGLGAAYHGESVFRDMSPDHEIAFSSRCASNIPLFALGAASEGELKVAGSHPEALYCTATMLSQGISLSPRTAC